MVAPVPLEDGDELRLLVRRGMVGPAHWDGLPCKRPGLAQVAGHSAPELPAEHLDSTTSRTK